MKLKSILGAMICATTLVCGATSVFAAGETFEIGTPIDLATLEEVTELEAGQVIAYPVDIITDQQIVSYGFDTACNEEYLTAGIADLSLTDEQWTNASSLGAIQVDLGNTSEDYDISIVALGETKRGVFTAYGYPGATVGMVNWYDAYARDVIDGPEFYLIYQVKKAVDLDSLNVELIVPNGQGKCVVGIYQVGDTLEETPNSAVSNACYGAFKINMDSSALSKWVQGLYVSIDGGSQIAVSEYVTTDDVNYSFPVRITAEKKVGETVTVDVYADTSTDEAGTANVANEKIGSFSVTLNSPSSYANNAVTVE